jgi:Bacterial regulatory proteins, tetR family
VSPRSAAANQQIKDARREALLVAARRVFTRNGLAATRVSDIAAEARVSLADAAGEATAGDVVVLNQNLREPVEALEDATVLAMVAWPDGAGAWDLEAGGGRL